MWWLVNPFVTLMGLWSCPLHFVFCSVYFVMLWDYQGYSNVEFRITMVINCRKFLYEQMAIWWLMLRKILQLMCTCVIACYWRDSPQWARASSFTRFLDHTWRRTTVGRTPLGEWSACRRDLYLTIHSTHNRQTSMLPVGFEPTTPAGERPQTYALDRAATGTGALM
jgi:hypothetical protein